MSIIQSRKRAALAAVAVSGIAAAWTAYTPTITAGTGTFTSVSATGRYLAVGKVIFFQIAITITTNNTAATYVLATLPATAVTGIVSPVAGRENALTAKMLQGVIGGVSTTTVAIQNYDGTYPGANGAILDISGCYEAA